MSVLKEINHSHLQINNNKMNRVKIQKLRHKHLLQMMRFKIYAFIEKYRLEFNELVSSKS